MYQLVQNLNADKDNINIVRSSSTGDVNLGNNIGIENDEANYLTQKLHLVSNNLNSLRDLRNKNNDHDFLKSSMDEALKVLLFSLNDLLQNHKSLKSSEILTISKALTDHIKGENFSDSIDEKNSFNLLIDKLASALTSSVSEYWLAKNFGNFINPCQFTKAKSIQFLAQVTQPEELNIHTMSPIYYEKSSEILKNIDCGVEVALQRAQAWSKYAKEISSYVDRRNNLWGDYCRNLAKLAKSVQQNISEDVYLPHHSLLTKALTQDIDLCNMGTAARNLIQNQLFVLVVNARRSEHEKIRKDLKYTWTKQSRKMHDADANLRKAKATYIGRIQDHERMKEQVLKSENESLSQSFGSKPDTKIEKRKKQEEEALNKAMEAEAYYKQCIIDANYVSNVLEQTKISILKNVRILLQESDVVLKQALGSYFKLMQTVTDTIPQHFSQLSDEANLYQPGRHYSDFLRQINITDYQPAIKKTFTFETNSAKNMDLHPFYTPDNTNQLEETDSVSCESSQTPESSPAASPFHHERKKLNRNQACIDDDDELIFSTLKLPLAAHSHQLGQALKSSGKCCHCNGDINTFGIECSRCDIKWHKNCLEYTTAACTSTNVYNQTEEVYTYPPSIVYRCVTEINERGLDLKGVYRLSAVKSKVDHLYTSMIGDCTEVNLTDVPPNVIANVLKLFLRQLREPLLTFKLYPLLMSIAKEEALLTPTTLKAVIEQLPAVNFQTCKLIFNHLRRVSENNEINQMCASNLSIIFAPTLIKQKDGISACHLNDTMFQSKIIEIFILHSEAIFESVDEVKLKSFFEHETKDKNKRATYSATLAYNSWAGPSLTDDLLTELAVEAPQFQKLRSQGHLISLTDNIDDDATKLSDEENI